MKPLLAATLALLLPLAAQASLAKAATFDEKVDSANSIILGKCVQQRSAWDADHKWILTWSTFKVEKAMKGSAQNEVTVVVPGGSVDGVHQESIGMPVFRQGEDNVVFIRDTPSGATVLYFEQGAYDVVRSEKGERVVRPVTTGSVFIDTQRGTAVAPEAARPLPQFESEVGASIRRAAKQRMEILRPRPKTKADSIVNILQRNRLLVMLTAFGLFLSAGQLFRR